MATTNTRSKRLLGIELGRGLSAYAVVLVHSGDATWGLPIASSAITFRLFFYFAVPFFLAAAFYFMTTKPEIGYSRKFWKSRIERIVIPYSIWSVIFLISRAVVFTINRQSERLQEFLQDPVSIIFLGGASYQLYFLPLLLVGSALTMLLPFFERFNINILGCSLLSILGVALCYLIDMSGNSFDLGNYIAFQGISNFLGVSLETQPVIRLLFVEARFLTMCLPYFFIAFTLNKSPILKKKPKKYSHWIWLSLFLIFDVLLRNILPEVIIAILLGFTALIFSITFSDVLQEESRIEEATLRENIIINLGKCSFGMYLIHPFAMNVVKPLLNRILPSLMNSVSIPSMVIISVLSFLVSWLLVACLSKSENLATYLFGI